MMLHYIKIMIDQALEEHQLDMINTICRIDECHRIDNMLQAALSREGLWGLDKQLEIDEEIERMIIDDIIYWEKVFDELNYYYYE